jgi:hypothetical protein
MCVHLQDGLYALSRPAIQSDAGFLARSASTRRCRGTARVFSALREYDSGDDTVRVREKSVLPPACSGEHGIIPGDIQTTGDLQKLPFTTRRI